MRLNSLHVALVTALAGAVPVSVLAGESQSSPPATTSPIAQEAPAPMGYLGVSLEPVPEALRSQLAGVLPTGQGIMIRDLIDDSPAAEAGLQDYDILVRFNDQLLFSPTQLVGLVRAEGSDQKVTLHLLRAGEPKQVEVTLGQAPTVNAVTAPLSQVPWMGHRGRWPHPAPALSEEQSTGWESFDSLTLQKLEDGQFKAEIQYLGPDGSLAKQQFTGSRDEIRQQILAQKSMPSTERDQLLEALSAREGPTFPWAPTMPHFLPPWLSWNPGF